MPETKVDVLIVENDRGTARDLQRTLTELGYDPCAVAASGEEAFAAATAHLPDVALVSVGIPGTGDGIAVAGILRTRFNIPVVFLASEFDSVGGTRANQAGAYGYALKPFRPAQLRSVIELAL